MTAERRRLIREYKETPRTMGVGVVRNNRSGKDLVVSGTDIPALLNRHKAQLRLGVHRNLALLADWQALGEQAFEFEVLDRLTPAEGPGSDPTADLEALATLWLEKLNPFEPAGYNARPRVRA
jgi:hypothetical protein